MPTKPSVPVNNGLWIVFIFGSSVFDPGGRKRSIRALLYEGSLGQITGHRLLQMFSEVVGTEDEVAAHCGLVIRGQNIDYNGHVEKVGP